MRPAMEDASSIWSPLASSTSNNKVQVMQNAALRTATGCTQDTNLQHLHDDTLILSIHEHLQLNATQSHPIKTHTILHHYKAKETLYSTTTTTQQQSHRPTHIHYNRYKTNTRRTLAQLRPNKPTFLKS